MSLKYTTIPTKTLADSINSSATSFRLNNIKSWDGETNVAAGDFGTQGFGVFRNATNSVIELFEFDPATVASATITIVRRGLKFDGDLTTEVAAYKRSWTKGDTYVDLGTDVPQFFQFLKEYIDDIAVSGSPNASTTAKGIVEIATAAQIDAETNVGETGAMLAISPDQFALSKYVTSTTLVVLAGETINGATLPVPVYQDTTDNEFYACDANDTSKLRFRGFAVSNGTNGANLSVQTGGVVTGFTGLDEGTKYYVQDTVGTIGTTPGTYGVLVGTAISQTSLLIQFGVGHRAGTGATGTDSGSEAITLGFRPTKIRLNAKYGANNIVSVMDAVWVNDTLVGIFTTYDEGTTGGAGATATVETSSTSKFVFTITSVTNTGFTITWTETGTASSCVYLWEAEGYL